MDAKTKEDGLIKSLLGSGFTEEYLDDMIAKGAIKIDEGKEGPEDEDLEEEETPKKKKGQKKKLEKLEEEEDEEEEGEDEEMKKNMEKEKEIDKRVEEKVEKSLMAFGKIMKSVVDDLSVQLDETKKIVKSISGQTPSFRSQGFEQHAVIEKSMENKVDDEGKLNLNVRTQRAAVREMIANTLEKEPDQDLKKSLSSSAFGYLCTEQATLPENVCQYLYSKNIRLVK